MKKIAVIGAGISGLGASWILSQKHEVHLFESEKRLGGHAHTVTTHGQESTQEIPVDTGFLVYNELTYPHLTAFFKELQVETVASDMSLAIQVQDKNLEWNGSNMNTVFAQRKNLLKPSFYRMLLDILRFHKEADKNLVLSRRHAWTLQELLQKKSYSDAFVNDYLIPMGAAIWSTPEKEMLEFPAATFLTFFINHHLLQVNNRPEWRTVKAGSIEYVKKLEAKLKNVHKGEAVLKITRDHQQVSITTSQKEYTFDAVVLATHAPTSLSLLQDASEQEKKILSAFRYEENKTVLHQDSRLMPKTPLSWAAWNVRAKRKNETDDKVSLTYYINRLQPLNSKESFFVTLNSPQTVDKVLGNFIYHHPQFTQQAIRAQRQLGSIQGQQNTYYAGAWTRYGFHEDGLLSAVKVGELFGVEPPWKVS